MPRRYRSNTRLMSSRLLVLLISVVVMGYALAASESKKTASRGSNVSPAATVETTSQETSPPSTYVPSEKVSAEKAVSFPTDI